MFLKDYEYNYLKECRAGVYDNEPMMVELREFFMKEFGVYLYGYICDPKDKSLYKNRLRYFVDEDCRYVFIENGEKVGNRDLAKEERLKNKFSDLCSKYGLFEPFVDPNNYFAIFSEFNYEMKAEIMGLCTPDIKNYLESFEEIKLIDICFNVVFIFYENISDVTKYKESGLSDEIIDHVFGIIREKDYLDAFKNPKVVFDSVQVLNEKYEGNLYYYHR